MTSSFTLIILIIKTKNQDIHYYENIISVIRNILILFNNLTKLNYSSNSIPFTSVYQFNNRFLNLLNKAPCKGLVRMSASMSPVGIYSTEISPLATLSAMKKYLIAM